jgi:glucokinase
VEARPVTEAVLQQMAEEDPSAVISQAALQQEDATCTEALQLFIRYLAMEAASLVLKLKATGGCYLSGGISPKILPALQQGDFLRYFTDAGRMRPLLEKVPVQVMLNQQAPLLGAAWYGAYNIG